VDWNNTDAEAIVALKDSTFDSPPPGPRGLTTVTDPVFGLAMSSARIVAVNCDRLTNVVARGLPFQYTSEPATKPVPFTVRVKLGPPGATLAGTRGLLMKGTGF
jgi:hypothetical protein